ncbi:hypothetical protein L2E82_45745 [Cichorium intybus]|uniref:Uncharacterized protein n=1 Tax=Cichorium intybus TaxID=13427 RepID=A0ACB8ZUD4_CICIN|nr:hypothetical protein L2E82_45745 [Cichorium intybus]
MGGKGKKRREKNYKEAHGVGKNRLPPPPVRSSLDVIPSKLRKLMSYTSGSGKLSVDGEENKRGGGARGGSGGGNSNENKLPTKEKSDSVVSESKMEGTNVVTEKKNKKRKRKPVNDLRFEAELGGGGSKRKERKKKLLEERKKKHKKPKEDEINFPGREEIKFGDVVKAPPKLVNVPKKFASSVNASQERIRLRAIEAYRDQKKWASRPGVHQPTIDITQASL